MKKILPIVLTALVASHTVNADTRLWLSNSTTDGNLAGLGTGTIRANADALCDADTGKPTIANSTTHAFMSIDANDEIRDMPTNYTIPTTEPILRADGTTQIAANFPALLNTATVALLGNSVFDTFFFVWTGSSANGELSTNTCNGWTLATSSGTSGQAGLSNSTSSTYMSLGPSNCAASTKLYCITYGTAAPAVPSVPSVSSGLSDWEE